MGTIFNAGVALGVLVTAAVATSELAVRDNAVRSISATPVNAGSGRQNYLLRDADAGNCLVTRGTVAGDGSSDVVAGKACDGLLAGLSQARIWMVEGDGSVALRTTSGETLARFALADGVDYESFQPRFPLMSLAEAD